MGRTKSERVAAEAFDAYRDGDLRGCIRTLVAYADRHVNNRTTAEVFRRAIDRELADVSGEVSQPEADAPRCVHCGSTCTFERSDGDVACNDCPGIMPQDGGDR
jgi:hypothetical protein